ncbi:MAG: hypothetical protein A2Y02_00840 [Omnitrophica bacterium GWA2_52_12]|nr:MAG: hypothetical protein A2Y02_00840 [Omnitrophica bacterium GWA2_52_12]
MFLPVQPLVFPIMLEKIKSKAPSQLSSRSTHRIFYLVPDHLVPSWGLGMLYHHVLFLRAAGYQAFLLHRSADFALPWLDCKAPVISLDSPPEFFDSDTLVVPEIFPLHPRARAWKGPKLIHIQGGMPAGATTDTDSLDYAAMGYQAALVQLPHLRPMAEKFGGLPASVIPPFIAPYFFLPKGSKPLPKKKQVVFYAKKRSPDYTAFKKIAPAVLKRCRPLPGAENWRLIELENYTHNAAAELMKESAFFVNLNFWEAFNSSVPEAMAAGCIAFCYEAVGGADFLRDKRNAFVFRSHHLYDLAGQLALALQRYDSDAAHFRSLLKNALRTAERFTADKTCESVVNFFDGFFARHCVPAPPQDRLSNEQLRSA